MDECSEIESATPDEEGLGARLKHTPTYDHWDNLFCLFVHKVLFLSQLRSGKDSGRKERKANFGLIKKNKIDF